MLYHIPHLNFRIHFRGSINVVFLNINAIPTPPTRSQNLNQMDQQIRTEHLLYACVQHVMRGGRTEALVLVWTAQCLLAREWDNVCLCSRRKWALEKASQWM